MSVVLGIVIKFAGIAPAEAASQGLVTSEATGCEQEQIACRRNVTPGEGRVLACCMRTGVRVSGYVWVKIPRGKAGNPQ